MPLRTVPKKTSIIFFVIIFVCLVLSLVYNGMAPVPVSDAVSPLQEGWSLTAEGKTKSNRSLSINYYGQSGEEVVFSNTIPPRAGQGSALCIQFYTSPFSVYFNDEKIYEYGFAATNAGYLSVGSGYHVIGLPEGGEGEIRIEAQLSKGAPAVSLSDAAIMPGPVFYRYLIQNHLFTLVAFIVLIAVFVHVLITGNMHTSHHTQSVPVLAALAFCAAIWISARSGLLQLFTDDLLLINGIDFISFFLLPLTAIRFVQIRLQIQDNRRLNLCLLAGNIFFIAACILHFTRLVDFTQSLVVFHALLVIDLVCIATSIFKKQESYSKDLKVLRIGVTILIISAAIEMILYYFLSFGFLKFSALEIGLLGFTLCMLYVWSTETRNTKKQLERQSIFRKMAYTDALTGLENRTAFDGMLKRLNRDKKESLHIFMIDLNHLKQVNDSMGHSEGDRYLQQSANVLQKEFAQNAQLFRIGGDEFVAVLESSHEDAAHILKRLRAYRAAMQGTPCHTFAVGCAAFDVKKDKRLQDTLRRADKLMYSYKKKLHLSESHPL